MAFVPVGGRSRPRDRILQRTETGSAFVATRPSATRPAHQGMGFCLVNNAAVSVGALRSQGERVLIVDWEVHHGNATQALFSEDPDVWYVSTHQWPCCPGTGHA